MAFIPAYVLILIFLIGVDYCLGIQIEKSAPSQRKMWLIFSLLSNLTILGIFKYYNFFNQIAADIAHCFHLQYPIPFLQIVLPIGLSFHTFQAMSYTIEVYRGNQKAERHLGIFALYVMFYPQLVAGPIERPYHLLPQFYERHSADLSRIVEGLKRMLWGLFKKVVIADRLALFVNAVFSSSEKQDGLSLLLAAYFFAFQIYCDFSGYSDIAIGAARVLGFRLVENFDNPYSSKSFSEFWRRWHISLSSWFRDYVYIPLSGNQGGTLRKAFNLFVVFLLSGLWHGAHWTFVIWGLLNACYVIVEFIAKRYIVPLNLPQAFKRFFGVLWTFNLTVLGWIFFRSGSVSDAWHYLSRLAERFSQTTFSKILIEAGHYFEQQLPEFYISIAAVSFLLAVENFKRPSIKKISPEMAAAFATFGYGLLIAVICLFGVFEDNRFIYFQF